MIGEIGGDAEEWLAASVRYEQGIRGKRSRDTITRSVHLLQAVAQSVCMCVRAGEEHKCRIDGPSQRRRFLGHPFS